jgi:Ni/Fe-hydrogenase b-type cytochrome subunit
MDAPADAIAEPRIDRRRVYRHRLVTRIWHWLNALAVLVLIPSGLMISNAHPRLYWGQYGANFDHAWLELPRFPGWATLPSHYSLAGARHWHLFFALVLAFGLLGYMVWGLASGHIAGKLRIRGRDLAPTALWTDLKAHLALRFHDPHDLRAYNIFQKLSYVAVIFGLIPLLVVTGLALSPGMWPWLVDLFGGRQSARSIHFIAMAATTLFIVVHLTLVILAEPINELRSMITGWWRAPEEDHS